MPATSFVDHDSFSFCLPLGGRPPFFPFSLDAADLRFDFTDPRQAGQ